MFTSEQLTHLDFGPGHAPYKELFSTDKQEYIDLYLFRKTLKNQFLSRLHLGVNQFSDKTGRFLDRIGIKSKIKKLIRKLNT
jgi:CelD/BcsL family acetyltransferase involved in cellulose biosynthesis